MNTSQNNSAGATLAELEAEQARLWRLFHAEETEKGGKTLYAEIKGVGRQINEIKKAAEQAKEAQKQALRQDLWASLQMEPVSFLASLREAIVNGPEPPKRTPKWRFRPAEDFALQIQAKDKARVLFEGLALEGAGINAGSFTENRGEHRDLRQLKFDIRPDGEMWILKPTFAYYGKVDVEKNEYGYQPSALVEEAGRLGLLALKTRIVETLGSIFQADEIPMLSDHCMACGKQLTDAVSRSRLIGPECAGKNSIVAPLFLQKKAVVVNSQIETVCYGEVGCEALGDDDVDEPWFFYYCEECDACDDGWEADLLPKPHVKDKQYSQA